MDGVILHTMEWTIGRHVKIVAASDVIASPCAVTIGGGRGQCLGGTMASAEHEPITGVWGQSPQRGPGAEPLVRVKLKAFWSLDVQRSRQI